MRIHRTLLPLFLLSIATVAFADPKPAFEKMKSLAGTWEGKVTTNPHRPDIEGAPAHVTLRVTSSGNALLHEGTSTARPDDPLTIFYIDNDRLTLTHYCDAGNRPRMVGTLSADGKTIDFEFLDVAGNMKYGHMHHIAFTFVDADHHTEDLVFMLPGDKATEAHLELTRTK